MFNSLRALLFARSVLFSQINNGDRRNPNQAVFKDLKSYKNGGVGIDLHGTCKITVKGGIIAVNGYGTLVMGNRPGSNILEDTQIYAVDDLHASGGGASTITEGQPGSASDSSQITRWSSLGTSPSRGTAPHRLGALSPAWRSN